MLRCLPKVDSTTAQGQAKQKSMMSSTNVAETVTGDASAADDASILVVDDEATIRLLLRKYLQKKGLDVSVAETAEAAWERIEDGDIDVVVSDISLPGMSGKALLERLHVSNPGIPVILITGLASLEDAVECVKKGAFDYVSKPLVLSDLLDRVLSALASRRRPSVTDTTATRRDRVAGYMLEGVIGEGATSIVFRARKEDDENAPIRAMKFLKIGGLPAQEKMSARERFLREADALSRIDHPHVVHFVEFGLVEDTGEPFLVMEFIDGRPMDECMTRFMDEELVTKCDLLRQIVGALAAIHRAELCHRDIKPANIMVLPETMEAKVADFGVVKVARSSLTSSGGIVGSPAYMAPEALDNSDVGPQADLFSFGVLAYEFLLGRRPFPSEDVERLVAQIKTSLPVDPWAVCEDMPEALRSVLAGLLRKRQSERYRCASDVLDDLEVILVGLRCGTNADPADLNAPPSPSPDWRITA